MYGMQVCTLICCGPLKENTSNDRTVRRRVIRRIRIEPANVAASGSRTTTINTEASTSATTEDRQGNIFTIANESSSNPLPHRCTDFFYVEPSSEDAARIRAQLEKDEKDLPTYEEVMAMSAAQAAAGTLSPPPTTASSTTIAITDATVPPYSEIDRNTTRAAPLTLESGATAWPIGNETAPSHGAGAASTSRAAAAAATSAPATTTVVTIANSVSNTSV
ncbi:uncharacterized protein LOC105216042 isoform X4 [Zeugodacus cucurbitae]|uniref:uncharacterized protein LOC105216042 isoform X4 n=1 Tax=Zeugodacus cucurbitae TaxID=28588 RepID=UPI0023D94CA0|nr:uncharacterized protein LOC105216042 isoform X4 [Zeugodacus cucurbitae]